MSVIPSFLGPSYFGRSNNINSSRCVNMFPEYDPNPGGKSKLALIGSPGTKLAFALPFGPNRGAYPFNGYMYRVGGNQLYQIDSAYNIVPIGQLNTSSGRVIFKDNGLNAQGVGGNQLALIDGQYGYIYNVLTKAFTQITSELVSVIDPTTNIVTTTGGGFPGNPSWIEFIDGYFVCGGNSMQFSASDLYHGDSWNALAQANVMATNDPVQGGVNYFNQLLLIKQLSSELWYNNSTPTSQGCPYSRIPGAVLPFGTKAPATIKQANNSVYMLGWQLQGDVAQCIGVVQYTGGIPNLVSPPNINYQIAQLGPVEDAFAFVYTRGPHTFYELTFPSANWTVVGDLAYPTITPWHERSTWSESQPWGGRHLADDYCLFNGKHYVGDYRNGNVYELREDVYTDNGDPIIAVRQSDIFFDNKELEPFPIFRLYVDCETGFGDPSPTIVETQFVVDSSGKRVVDGSGNYVTVTGPVQAPPPQATLSWSNDSGYTWSNEHEASLGYQGQYKTRLIWRRLGPAVNKVFRLSISAPVRRILVNAYME